MASSVALSEAREHLSELLDRAENGEEILIERAGHRAVRLVATPSSATPGERRVGGRNLLGITYIAPDFDEPMSEEELKEWSCWGVRLLLDSHILLRLDHNPELVPAWQRNIHADKANDIYVSAATVWELGIKASKGKLILATLVCVQRFGLGSWSCPSPPLTRSTPRHCL